MWVVYCGCVFACVCLYMCLCACACVYVCVYVKERERECVSTDEVSIEATTKLYFSRLGSLFISAFLSDSLSLSLSSHTHFLSLTLTLSHFYSFSFTLAFFKCTLLFILAVQQKTFFSHGDLVFVFLVLFKALNLFRKTSNLFYNII